MPYGVNTESFNNLEMRVNELPEELSTNPRDFEGLLFAYLHAFDTMLQLTMAIMQVCAEREERRQYISLFLPVYERAAKRILQLLDSEIREGMEGQTENLYELINAIRDSQISFELVTLDRALSDTANTAEPIDHLDTVTTVTNSLKEQIEKHTKRKWIKSVLHTLNEIIGIVRGVVG